MRQVFWGLVFMNFCTSAIAQMGTNDNLADPNLLGLDALGSLPHISEELASKVVEGRPYLSATELDGVLSVSLDESEREDIYGEMFRQIDLNNASDEEIMLIPGMTGRMAHEFEEYRPYTSLAQFRREIGKYVSEEEVARFQQRHKQLLSKGDPYYNINLSLDSEQFGIAPALKHLFRDSN